ncbi:pentatricopeptide repeat-containing protein At4g19220, mitochondrial [Impatiens glandulifera]|uniref:pentatricopeptide repeat-containing protein At4g19220, mitochondrial n=1 Tax=Impatiens glandulifera TaxID=253017 RepID=UPI001FB0E096|nr:pentatricopeptide repeat-containing protein At4g19220, mitochondrial [Impatiens glandulifera]
MRNWVIQPKVLIFRRTAATSKLKIACFPVFRHRITQFCFPFHFPSFYGYPTQRNAFLSIKTFTSLPGFCQYSGPHHLFDKIPQREMCFQNVSFSHVLDQIKLSAAKPTHLSNAKLHCLALKVGFLTYLPICTSVLMAYSKGGYFHFSRKLFEEIIHKDVIICNAMMTAAVENGYFEITLIYFRKMMQNGNWFDATSVLIILSNLSDHDKERKSLCLHSLGLKSGLLVDHCLCNAFIDMYAKCGDLNSSERVFTEMHSRDLVSWNAIINGCLYNDNPEKCLVYFRKMTFFDELADNVSLSSAIAASTCLFEFENGQAIHGYGIKLGYMDNTQSSVANSLISFYSHFGDVDAAETIFRRMSFKDMVSWNSIIDGFASNGNVWKVIEIMSEMSRPDEVTILTIIPLCAEYILLREGKSVHAYSIRRDFSLCSSVINNLMDMYSKCDEINAAELLFNSTSAKDLVSYNTMMFGYSMNGVSKKAHMLFKELLWLKPEFSISTALAILSSCNSSEFREFGKSSHSWLLKVGFLRDIHVLNSLMSMYVNTGDLSLAISVFSRNYDIMDTASWNTILAGYICNFRFEETLTTFNKMRRESRFGLDSITLVNVISACGNRESVIEGQVIHGLVFKTRAGVDTRVQNGLITMYGRLGEIDNAELVFMLFENHNLSSWNYLVSAFSRNERGKRALELFRVMDFEPNEVTIASALSACSQIGFSRHGKEIHGRVIRVGFDKNPFVHSGLVDMYSNCGMLENAKQVFRIIPKKSVSAWNSMISGYGFHGDGFKAMELFDEMIRFGLSPTSCTFTNLLSVCGHLGLINEGCFYYDKMLDEFGIEPQTEHKVCIVDMLGRNGMLIEAYEFMKGMGTIPEAGIWGALLSSCGYHEDVEMGKEVAKVLFRLEPKNISNYVCLFNMYVGAGRWFEADELRRIMDDLRVRKPAGHSLIDVGMG